MSPNRIYVWRFEEATEEYRRLSDNGGDEDWLVLVPSHVANDNWIVPFWIEAMDSCREPQEHKTDEGDLVYIGSHA